MPCRKYDGTHAKPDASSRSWRCTSHANANHTTLETQAQHFNRRHSLHCLPLPAILCIACRCLPLSALPAVACHSLHCPANAPILCIAPAQPHNHATNRHPPDTPVLLTISTHVHPPRLEPPVHECGCEQHTRHVNLIRRCMMNMWGITICRLASHFMSIWTCHASSVSWLSSPTPCKCYMINAANASIPQVTRKPPAMMPLC